MPKVSVVIPAYNAMQYIEKTLNSVFQQTFTDYEILIINDGSKDNIIEWVNQIEDARVRLITQANQGLPGARNTGIKHAVGEYIAFLDADDLWESSKLEKQVRYLDRHPEVGLVSSRVILIDQEDQFLYDVGVPETERIPLEKLLVANLILCGSTPLVRRECFEASGVFDPYLRSAEDWDMWIRIAVRYPIAAILEPLVLYRQHTNNMSKDFTLMTSQVEKFMQNVRTVVPSRLHYLLGRGYSFVSLQAAWGTMDRGQYGQTFFFIKKCLLSNPSIVFHKPFLQVTFLTIAKTILPGQIYTAIKKYAALLKARPAA